MKTYLRCIFLFVAVVRLSAQIDVSGSGVSLSGLAGISTYDVLSRYPTVGFNAYGAAYYAGRTGAQAVVQFDTTSNTLITYLDSATTAGSAMSPVPLMQIAAGSSGMRFHAYGAGTLMTDSSGNITSTSDERAKDTIGDFTTGLAAIRLLRPKKYHWKKETGLNTDDLNVSVYAQDLIAAGLPEAVSTRRTEEETETVDLTIYIDAQGRPLDPNLPANVLATATTKTIQITRPKKNAAGETSTKKVDAVYYTVSDRAVIAALINATKELAAKNEALEARLAKLEAVQPH